MNKELFKDTIIYLSKGIKVTLITLKLITFIIFLFTALLIKFFREIVCGFLRCIDYLTNLGIDDVDGKIIRLFEKIKKTGYEFKI